MGLVCLVEVIELVNWSVSWCGRQGAPESSSRPDSNGGGGLFDGEHNHTSKFQFFLLLKSTNKLHFPMSPEASWRSSEARRVSRRAWMKVDGAERPLVHLR